VNVFILSQNKQNKPIGENQQAQTHTHTHHTRTQKHSQYISFQQCLTFSIKNG